MARVIDVLSDPSTRALVRAFWLPTAPPSLSTPEELTAVAIGPVQVPEERSFDISDEAFEVVTWRVRVPYPVGFATVGALVLISAEGELLAVGGAVEPWATVANGGSAEATLTVSEAYPWP